VEMVLIRNSQNPGILSIGPSMLQESLQILGGRLNEIMHMSTEKSVIT